MQEQYVKSRMHKLKREYTAPVAGALERAMQYRRFDKHLRANEINSSKHSPAGCHLASCDINAVSNKDRIETLRDVDASLGRRSDVKRKVWNQRSVASFKPRMLKALYRAAKDLHFEANTMRELGDVMLTVLTRKQWRIAAYIVVFARIRQLHPIPHTCQVRTSLLCFIVDFQVE
jgi:hypothetical protein